MKQILLILFFVLFVYSQDNTQIYTNSGSNSGQATGIYYSSGNIGIGVNSPSELLDIAGGIRVGSMTTNINEQAYVNLYEANSHGIRLLLNGVTNVFHLKTRLDGVDEVNAISIPYFGANKGNVGLGTSDPSERLDVTSGIRVGSKSYNLSEQAYINMYEGNLHGIRFYLDGNSNTFHIKTRLDGVDELNALSIPYWGSNKGNVGIGTTNPIYKFQVNMESNEGPVFIRRMYQSQYTADPILSLSGHSSNDFNYRALNFQSVKFDTHNQDYAIISNGQLYWDAADNNKLKIKSSAYQHGTGLLFNLNGTNIVSNSNGQSGNPGATGDIKYITTFHRSGNVGIGTTDPQKAKLVVKDGIGKTAAIFGSHYLPVSIVYDHPSIGFNTYYDNGWKVFSKDKYSGFLGLNPNDGSFQISTGDAPSIDGAAVNMETRLFVKNDGNVGIGTTNTNGAKLAVNGDIHAKKVKVTLQGWPDYVFSDSYKLKSLEEIEAHIKEKKHLPGIPSQKEIEENGLDLGDMQAKMMEKIEELTLHTIEMNKELNQLKMQNEKLKERVKVLEN
jgi:hypothetical protein